MDTQFMFLNQVNRLKENNPAKDFLRSTPSDLPVPVDDGGCNYLQGLTLPSVNLPSTSGFTINPSQVPWLARYLLLFQNDKANLPRLLCNFFRFNFNHHHRHMRVTRSI